MPTYFFSINDRDAAPSRERSAALPDDNSAWDYGETIVRTLLHRDLDEDKSQVLVISEGERIIASIAFNIAALRRRRNIH